MNKKGFTLIELIATIVVLGVIMTIVVVSITGNINSSKDDSFVNLGKNYAESVRAMRSNGELYYEPKTDEAVLIPYEQVKGLEINNSDVTGYGKILPSYCFISVLNKNNNYLYYINQVDESYHILDRKENNNVSKDDIEASEDILSNLAQVKTPLSSFHINYDGNNYSLKGVRVEFLSKYKKESNKFITNFDLIDRGITFKGRLSLYNWTSNDSSKKIELKIDNNKIGELSNKTYTFKREQNGAYGIWKAVDTSGNQLFVNGKTLEIDVRVIDNEFVVFDLRIDNQITYEGVTTTSDVILSGYYTGDSSYSLSNAQIKGNITAYDNYVNGIPLSSNNEFTIDGIKYLVNSSRIQYIVVKK